jgi:hypothetical protein
MSSTTVNIAFPVAGRRRPLSSSTPEGVVMNVVASTPPTDSTARAGSLRADALSVAGFASLAAGAVHAAATGVHNEHRQAVLLFTLVAGFQLFWGALAVARANRIIAAVGALGQLGLVGGWIFAKGNGIGFIDGMESKEPAAFADTLAAGLAAVAVVGCAVTLARPGWQARSLARLGVVGSCGALLVVAVPGMVAASSADHHGGGAAHGTDDHHGTTPGGGVDAADDGSAATGPPAVVPPVPYDPTLPIDLGGVEGVTPQEQARAENLIATTLGHLPVFADPAVAEAAGYASIHDGGTGYEHLINNEYRSDGRVLDPDRPESLVYQVRNGSRQLVAAMYMAEPGTTLETTPELGGALTQWHIHDNLCFSESGTVAGLTDASGACAPGLIKPEAVPMIHVWIVPHPCGPFAALDGIAGGSILPGEERLCDTAHGH